MGKARRALWWDSLFSHACCTPEVPVSWACRDSILYRPLGVSCSGHYPERELHLQSEAVFHNVLSPRGSVSVSSMQVFEPGLSSRHVPRMCTRMHTHLTLPSVLRVGTTTLHLCVTGGDRADPDLVLLKSHQWLTVAATQRSAGWLCPHRRFTCYESFASPGVDICRLFPTSTSRKDLIFILFCWCPRSKYL